MASDKIWSFINEKWDRECVPKLEEYIRIPCQSPHFDKEWESNGHLDKAMDLLHDWVKSQNFSGLKSEKLTEPGKTPFLIIEIPASDNKQNTILMYGHMDKQPPLLPWAEGLGPYDPVIRDGKLYGRGGADDGYAVFAALTSVQAMHEAGLKHGRIVIVIEACEESGSPDLPGWINKVKDQIGTPDLLICLDSGSLNYDQMWLTSSLRGMIAGQLRVELLNEGIHSGIAGGLVPCTFRLLRQLLSRLEDEQTGEMKVPELKVDIPEAVIKQMQVINELGPDVLTKDLPLKTGAKPFDGTSAELAIANTWKPCLAVTGIDGLPELSKAGNVLRTHTAANLSIRLAPGVNPAKAAEAVKKVLEADPPHGAHVTFNVSSKARGWSAPPIDPWVHTAVNDASQKLFGKPYGLTGCGGSIPFMAMLGDMFPQAQFVITGVLGPQSNAHGPNEFMHIDYTKRIACCVASILDAHYNVKCN